VLCSAKWRSQAPSRTYTGSSDSRSHPAFYLSSDHFQLWTLTINTPSLHFQSCESVLLLLDELSCSDTASWSHSAISCNSPTITSELFSVLPGFQTTMHQFPDETWITRSQEITSSNHAYIYQAFGLDNISKAQWMRELPRAVVEVVERTRLSQAEDLLKLQEAL
jgi:hypothetical protein